MPITERKGKNGISFQITVNRGYKFNANGDYEKIVSLPHIVHQKVSI